MLKIKRYYKPFIWLLIIAICLLAVQAICDLKLPDYMSNIVNVGIQSKGIERATPEAISEKGLLFITTFMDEENRKLTTDNYTKVEKGNSNYVSKYPLVKEENIYVLDNMNEEIFNKIGDNFATATYAFINVMKEISKQNGQSSEMNISEKSGENLDLTVMYQILPMVNIIPEEVMQKAREDAENTDKMMKDQVGVMFTAAFYNELGMDTAKMQQNYIMLTGSKMLGITLLGTIASIIVGFLGARIGAGVAKRLRKDVFEKVQSFSNEEFDKFSGASLITRTTNDITGVQNITTMGMRMLLYSPIVGVGAIFMMLQKGSTMEWTLGVGIVAILLLILVMFKFALPKFKIIQKLTDRLNLISKENLTGVMVTRAFRAQKHEEKRFDEINTETAKVNQFISRMMGFMFPCMMLIMNLLMLLIVWVGADKISNSMMQIGDMMAFIQYSMQVIMAFLMISMIFIMLPRASISANRISEVLDTESKIKDPKNPKEFKKDMIGVVEFKDVSFSYEDADEKVLENISFIAKPGETTAFIGSTGSGKSTLINLIPRFFDVTEGEILVNGVNVKNVTSYELHNQIGYIPQKGNLLSGTIESNLKYGNPEATNEFMEKCAKVAQATDFIESKEEEYNSPIAQGAKNVSGGQKQRLSIARALVKDAPIYIFDDSFSALDFKTDSNLREALKKHTSKATLLIVAQRVNTIMNAEQIVVLDQGKVVGIGTHAELLKSCPTYYEIASSQLSKEELEHGRK